VYDSSRTVRFKGNVYARPDWFATDVTKGVTRTPDGERICALSSDFLLGFRDAIVYECGPAADTVLRGAGRRWGGQFVHRLDRSAKEHHLAPLRELQRGIQMTILADAFATHGWGKIKVFWDRWPEYLGVEIENSIYPDLIIQADTPSDPLFAGFVRAVFEYLLETQLDCVQTDCPTRDATASRFVLASPARTADIASTYAKQLGDEGTCRAVLASAP
jgi:uncharacterized protein